MAEATLTPDAQRVVRTYYSLTLGFNVSGALIWGVNTLVMLGAGLSLVEAFMANAVFTAAQVVLEIPTGVIADTRGRRLSFLLAIATLLVASVMVVALSLTHAALIWWLAANVLLGLGFTFYSGATEAWFVDALHANGYQGDLDAFFARGAQLFGVGMLAGAMLGGVLGSLDLSLPWAGRAVLLGALLILGSLRMHDEGFTTRPFKAADVPKEVADVWHASIRHGWRNPAVRLLMMLSFLHMGFLIWGWYAWQPYFLQLLGRPDLIWVAGAIASAISLVMIVGNQIVRVYGGKVRRETLIIVGSIGLPLSMIGVGLAPSFVTAVAIFLAGMLVFGIMGPAKQSAFHKLIPGAQRATIVSFDGLVASAGGVGSQVALAYIAESFGYGTGYLVGGAALLLGVPVALVFARRCREAPRIGELEGDPLATA